MISLPRPQYRPLLVGTIVFCMTGLALFYMGRLPIAQSGTVLLWSGDVMSADNSQQIFDPYSFTHLVHGFVFYLILWLILSPVSFAWRAVVALVAEAVWEIGENTPTVIEYYRSVTISLGYYGDTILNSLSDMFVMLIGFWLARRLPVWGTVLLIIVLEIALVYTIRDNFLLNIIMFVYPSPTILAWQNAV